MSLIEGVLDAIVESAMSGRDRVAACAAYGVSCEGWLKVELLHKLVAALGRSEGTEILVEFRNVDLTVRTRSEEVLVQLKTFPTNYGRAGKPITNFVAGVADDLRKLAEKRPSTGIGLAAWMAYVVPEPIPPSWPGHLARIEAASTRTLRAERIPLWGKAFANLYVMESK